MAFVFSIVLVMLMICPVNRLRTDVTFVSLAAISWRKVFFHFPILICSKKQIFAIVTFVIKYCIIDTRLCSCSPSDDVHIVIRPH